MKLLIYFNSTYLLEPIVISHAYFLRSHYVIFWGGAGTLGPSKRGYTVGLANYQFACMNKVCKWARKSYLITQKCSKLQIVEFAFADQSLLDHLMLKYGCLQFSGLFFFLSQNNVSRPHFVENRYLTAVVVL